MIRLSGAIPAKYGLRLNSEAKYLELKEQLRDLCDIEPERLLLAEVAYSQIKQILSDDTKISTLTATELFAYELPECRDESEQDSLDGNSGRITRIFLKNLSVSFPDNYVNTFFTVVL